MQDKKDTLSYTFQSLPNPIRQPSRDGEMLRVTAASNLVLINGIMLPNPIRQPSRDEEMPSGRNLTLSFDGKRALPEIRQPTGDGDFLRDEEFSQDEFSPSLSFDGKRVLPKIRQPSRGTPFG